MYSSNSTSTGGRNVVRSTGGTSGATVRTTGGTTGTTVRTTGGTNGATVRTTGGTQVVQGGPRTSLTTTTQTTGTTGTIRSSAPTTTTTTKTSKVVSQNGSTKLSGTDAPAEVTNGLTVRTFDADKK